jgi:hypothetical protein
MPKRLSELTETVAVVGEDYLLTVQDGVSYKTPISQLGDLLVSSDDFSAHIAQGTDAHDASAISLLDTEAFYSAANVEDALAESHSNLEAEVLNRDAAIADAINAMPPLQSADETYATVVTIDGITYWTPVDIAKASDVAGGEAISFEEAVLSLSLERFVPAAPLNMNGFRIFNGADPVADQDFATKAYADSVGGGDINTGEFNVTDGTASHGAISGLVNVFGQQIGVYDNDGDTDPLVALRHVEGADAGVVFSDGSGFDASISRTGAAELTVSADTVIIDADIGVLSSGTLPNGGKWEIVEVGVFTCPTIRLYNDASDTNPDLVLGTNVFGGIGISLGDPTTDAVIDWSLLRDGAASALISGSVNLNGDLVVSDDLTVTDIATVGTLQSGTLANGGSFVLTDGGASALPFFGIKRTAAHTNYDVLLGTIFGVSGLFFGNPDASDDNTVEVWMARSGTNAMTLNAANGVTTSADLIVTGGTLTLNTDIILDRTGANTLSVAASAGTSFSGPVTSTSILSGTLTNGGKWSLADDGANKTPALKLWSNSAHTNFDIMLGTNVLGAPGLFLGDRSTSDDNPFDWSIIRSGAGVAGISGALTIAPTSAITALTTTVTAVDTIVQKLVSTSTADDPTMNIVQGRQTTTTNTNPTMNTIAVATGQVMVIEATVYGRCTGGASGTVGHGAMTRTMGVFRNDSGTITQVTGSPDVQALAQDSSFTGAIGDLSISGTNVLVRAIGSTNVAATWHSFVRYWPVAS